MPSETAEQVVGLYGYVFCKVLPVCDIWGGRKSMS